MTWLSKRTLYALRYAFGCSSLLIAWLLSWRPNRPAYGTTWTIIPHLQGKPTPIRGRDAPWDALPYMTVDRGLWTRGYIEARTVPRYTPRPDCGTVTTRTSVARPSQYKRTTHYRSRITDSPQPLQTWYLPDRAGISVSSQSFIDAAMWLC